MSDLIEVYGPDFIKNSGTSTHEKSSSRKKSKSSSSSRKSSQQQHPAQPKSGDGEKLVDEIYEQESQQIDREKRKKHAASINVNGKRFVPRFMTSQNNTDSDNDNADDHEKGLTEFSPDLDEEAVTMNALKGGSRGNVKGSHTMAGTEDDVMVLKEDADFAQKLDENLRAATADGIGMFGGMSAYDAGSDAYGSF
jgi:hypothetical protein